MRIAIIGGTGKEGGGLAIRWARAGHAVVIGSRDGEKARARAAELNAACDGAAAVAVAGADNVEAAGSAEVAVLTVPYAAHAETLRAIKTVMAGKVLVDVTVPLKPPKVGRVQLPPGRAAALEAQELLGPSTPVAAALHHVSHAHLADPNAAIDCDVLVVADDERARTVALELVRALGLRGLDAGPLDNAVALESLTPVLIHLNKKYKSAGAGIVFTEIPDGAG
ncbi:MAG: NADPH-dependent F420 reductase [Myxococcales bacterium]|nr:NADPH-dependent F420 reductase [Myxococcales bacterium]